MVMLVENPNYLTPQEVAEALRLTPRTVHNLIERGELVAYRFGRQYRIPREAFEEYVRRSRLQPDT
jgi:putative molybdopterin biosynthesis protein